MAIHTGGLVYIDEYAEDSSDTNDDKTKSNAEEEVDNIIATSDDLESEANKTEEFSNSQDKTECETSILQRFLRQNKEAEQEWIRGNKCDACSKQFANKKKLWHHKNSSHPKRQFKCDDCEYIATQKAHLKKHIKCFHGSKATSGASCYKVFSHAKIA